MKSTLRLILALLLLGVITASAVLLTRQTVRVQADLTEDGLYTLSEGTERILGNLNQPITVKLYYGRTAAMKAPPEVRSWNNRFLYIRDLLGEYVRLSGGKIKLEVIDPVTPSYEEQEARSNGIEPILLRDGVTNYYFGMTAVSELGRRETIPMFRPENEELVEYEISKAISSLIRPDRPTIGVVSSLPIMGTPRHMMRMMQMQGRRPVPPWGIIRQMQMDYHVRSVRLDSHEVPEGIDLLMVVHPKTLDLKAIFAIDQFVMKGGKLMLFVDPHCYSDRPPQTPGNPAAAAAAAAGHKTSSGINNLLLSWGRVVSPTKITVDPALATKASLGGPPEVYQHYLTLNDKCVNPDEVMVSNLRGISMVFPGAIKGHGGTKATFKPLLLTTNTGARWRPEASDQGPMKTYWQGLPEKIKKNAVVDGDPLILAALITGEIATKFSGGLDIAEDGTVSEPMPGRPATTQPETQPADKSRHVESIKTARDGAAVLVVADVDIISDAACYRRGPRGLMQAGGNVPFVLNALEYLSGSRDLITLRSRARFSRPFTVVDEMEAKAKEDSAKKRSEGNEKKKKLLEERDAELAAERDKDGFIATLFKSQRKFDEQIEEVEDNLLKIEIGERVEIDALEQRLKMINVAAASAILLLIAVALWLVRYFRAKHYAAQRA